jgi:uncharacterized membrane protein YoaK (UPF0700 family)
MDNKFSIDSAAGAAGVLENVGVDSLKPLFAGAVSPSPRLPRDLLCARLRVRSEWKNRNCPGMSAVGALGVQDALVQVSLHGVPTTAVMTTNVARFTTDIGTILFGAGRADEDVARRSADKIWSSVVDFAVGCCIGAFRESRYGLNAVAFPNGIALIAFAMAWAAPFRSESGGRGDQAPA